MRAKTAGALALALSMVGAALLVQRAVPPPPPPAASAPPPAVTRVIELDDEERDPGADRRLTMPTGAPTMLTCDEGRRIVAQARSSLAGLPPPIDVEKLAEATADWLDPHGLWSVAPDAPAGDLIKKLSAELLADVEAPAGSGPCKAALSVGGVLSVWSTSLRRTFDESFQASATKARPFAVPEVWSAASTSPFESGAVTRDAQDLAKDMGRSAGIVASAYGPRVEPFTSAVRDRVAPALGDEGWSRAVVAAVVRAYVPQLDAHGAWAPLEEELSIYDLDLEVDPPERVWTEMTRTTLGVRIDKGAIAPLVNGDVVLRIHDVALAGVSMEQAEQLAVVTDAPDPHVIVLRPGAPEPLDLAVALSTNDGVSAAPPPELPLDLVRYGDGKAAIVAIPDVPDDLGARLSEALERARETPNVRGVLLDLRGNGGGSTDGAADALGLFLPGVPLFPMKRRDGGIETERARVAPIEQQWTGPVGVLVDGDSASAAEMIAGALLAYRRGVIVGDRTYGKGCAQEYLDDDARAGVLRLTTLLYALPDGSPVQKTGIFPEIKLSLKADDEAEAKVARALGPWRGPDVRDPLRVREVPWRSHGGRVGPCRDEAACRALRALGAAPAAAR